MNAIDQTAMPRSAQANINAVVKLEEEARRERRPIDRISDGIASFVGSVWFVIVHVIWFAVWASLNTGLLGRFWKFDPYPFGLLSVLISLEGLLISTFVLIKQNRMSQRTEQRDHLHLQINLLAEKEVTKLLQMQRLICARLGITEAEMDEETVELSHVTAVNNLANQVERSIPNEG